ncbi:MAG: hypothetical protein ACPG5B_14900 [Chitinophagales bacterium]
MIDKKRLIGFHGTNFFLARKIVTDKFTAQHNPKHWLGQGIYLFEEEYLAKWWAEGKFKYQKSAIIKVTIEALESQILNLDTQKGMTFFRQKIKELLISNNNLKKSLSFSRKTPYKNICLLLDLIKKELGIKVIIGTFVKSNPTYAEDKEYYFFQKRHSLPSTLFYANYDETQICLTDESVVINKEILSQNEQKWQ